MGGASNWGMSTTHVPSLRAAIAGRALANIRRLLGAGRISSAELGRWLSTEEIAILRAGAELPEWLPMSFGEHLLELMRAVEGGDESYMRKRGEETARLLLSAHLQEQLETRKLLKRGDATRDERFAAFGRDLSRCASFVRSNLNFTTWTIKRDPSIEYRHVIQVDEAAPLPDLFVIQLEGFLNGVSAVCELPDLWSSARARVDRVVFRMTRSL